MGWILTLSYLVTQLSGHPECSPMPDLLDGMCIHGAEVEELGDPVTKDIVLNVYNGSSARKDCYDQAVRYAENIEPLPPGIILQIADGEPMTYTCRGPKE